MKKTVLLLLLLQLSLFTACNSEKAQVIKKFPQATNSSRTANTVVCRNCRATFKISSAMHKMHDGHEYIECPICHHDYLKKVN